MNTQLYLFSKHWQLAPETFSDGSVDGVADVEQSMINILSTRKGSDVLRPDFGSDHFSYIDAPEDVFRVFAVREVWLAIKTWEKRAELEQVVITGYAPHLFLNVHWRLADDIAGELNVTTLAVVKELGV